MSEKEQNENPEKTPSFFRRKIGILVIILIIIGIISLGIFLMPGSQEDLDYTYVNVSYYGIHKLQCPVCNATGSDLQITGHDFVPGEGFNTKDTVTIIFCQNCSHEYKAK